MPTQLILHVITAADVSIPPRLNALDGRTLPEWLERESSGELILEVREHQSPRPSVDIAGDDLQAMFREFVPSPPRGQLASEIALLFCRSWLFRDLAGLMFDYDGSDLPPDARLTFDGVPRQACAVFLDGQRTTFDGDYLYVALHELGHVFNLHHDLSGRSFMGFDVRGPLSFLESDRAKLRAAGAGQLPEREEHLPGGVPFSANGRFRTTGAAPGRARGGRGGVEIRLAASGFLIGEPVVVDATVQLPAGARLAAGGLEPGYDGVRIWYRTPTGEVRLFAPLRHYCPLGRHRSPRRARRVIRNNIRVHLGRRGLSFREPGRYRLWAEVDVCSRRGQRSTLASRAVDLEIRRPGDAQEHALSAALSDPQIAHFVANRAGALDPVRNDAVARLLVDAVPEHPAARHLRYAAATSALRCGDRNTAAELLRGVRFAQRSLQDGVRRLHRALSDNRSMPTRRGTA